MILPKSKCFVGLTELRGLKLGLGCDMDPRLDSDQAMSHYIYTIDKHHDVLDMLMPDDDSIPCVKREWRLSEFDKEVIELASRAWLKTGETMALVLKWMGANPPPLALDCRHGEQQVQFKLYDRDDLRQQIEELKSIKTK